VAFLTDDALFILDYGSMADLRALTLTKAGTGTGTVWASPSGLCGPECTSKTLTVPARTTVTLMATPDAGSYFAGWSGDADCLDGVVTVSSAAASCTATFTAFSAFGKLTPPNLATLEQPEVTLTWSAAVGATSYRVCVNPSSSTQCGDDGGQWIVSATTAPLANLQPGTYSWQVEAIFPQGVAQADETTWWSFTIEPPQGSSPTAAPRVAPRPSDPQAAQPGTGTARGRPAVERRPEPTRDRPKAVPRKTPTTSGASRRPSSDEARGRRISR
jgi:hypothetical protein